MRILGLNFGDKTVGVSLSDPFGWTAQGLEVIRRKDENALKKTIKRLSEIIGEYGVTSIVLGYPKNMDNTEGARCEKTLVFKKMLEKHFKLPVILQDERLSTAAANRTLLEADLSRSKRAGVIDKQAAIFILQGYLDSIVNKNKEEVKLVDENNEFDDLELDGDEEYVETIIMTDDDGTEVEYLIIDEVEHDNKTFLLVVESSNADDDEADALIFKQVEESENEFVYEALSDEEFNEVAKILSGRLDEYEIDY